MNRVVSALLETGVPILIRNSEAETQATCRRKWYFSGALHRNLMPLGEPIAALWFGTGFHFSLEDFHGYNRFGDPRKAFTAYINAHREGELPPEWPELIDLADQMLGYYLDHWLPRRNDLETLWIDGVPQVEVRWEVPVPGTRVTATGTFDRVARDPWGRLVLVDYKTYKRQDSEKLEMDRQVSTYLWAANQLYGEVLGLYHYQFTKAKPEYPREIRGGGFSQDRSQSVTYALYHAALIEKYFTVPQSYVAFLNYLTQQETPDGDMLIRRTLATRSPVFLAHHALAISAQYGEMSDPNLPIYPAPGYNCKFCPFRQPCLATDLEADAEFLLQAGYVSRSQPVAWQARLEWPDGMVGVS